MYVHIYTQNTKVKSHCQWATLVKLDMENVTTEILDIRKKSYPAFKQKKESKINNWKKTVNSDATR